MSLLHRAVGTGDVELVTLLLDRGADPNERAAWVSGSQDSRSDATSPPHILSMMQGWYSPLHLACKRGDADLIWLLLERGAKWSTVDKVRRVDREPCGDEPKHGSALWIRR